MTCKRKHWGMGEGGGGGGGQYVDISRVPDQNGISLLYIMLDDLLCFSRVHSQRSMLIYQVLFFIHSRL